jgi:hypothetical protein
MKKFLLTIFVVPVLMQFATAQQASHPSEKGFSFAVYGDSRLGLLHCWRWSGEA